MTFTAVFPHSVGEVGSLRVYQDNQIEAGNSAHWSAVRAGRTNWIEIGIMGLPEQPVCRSGSP